MKREKPKFSDLQGFLDAAVKQAVQSGHMPETDAEKAAANMIDQVVVEAAVDLVAKLKLDAPSMLREHQAFNKGFVSRNRRRWKKGFDTLEMMIVMSQEIGELIYTRQSAKDQGKDDMFTALITLHARAVLVAREILCLMQGGFADGALGRWRTLHEVGVTANFLAGQSNDISRRYLLRRELETYKAAKQYRRYEKAANLEPFGNKELAYLEKRKNEIVLEQGKSIFDEDWGWASPVLGKQRPTFAAIEEHCGLDHWRPRYKWASQDTHGNHRPHMTLLAMSETEQPTILVGPSNSGMVDPAQMMARSLMIANSALIQLEPNLEILIAEQALKMIDNEVGKTFLKLERASIKRHRKMQAKTILESTLERVLE